MGVAVFTADASGVFPDEIPCHIDFNGHFICATVYTSWEVMNPYLELAIFRIHDVGIVWSHSGNVINVE